MPLDCTAAPAEPVTGIRLEFSGAILETYRLLQGHWVFFIRQGSSRIGSDRITGKDGSLSGALLVSLFSLTQGLISPPTDTDNFNYYSTEITGDSRKS